MVHSRLSTYESPRPGLVYSRFGDEIMTNNKNFKVTFYVITILFIIFGIVSILLSYFDLVKYGIDRLIRDLVVITIGIIILVMLIRSELTKYNWINGTTLSNFFFFLFSIIIISQIIKMISVPSLNNLFPVIIIIFLAGIFFNTLKNLYGTYLFQHYKSSTSIIEKIEDLFTVKKIKYEKRGPQKPSIKNLIEFNESLYITKWNITINISSKGITIGKINSTNKSKIDQLIKSINNEIEKI